MFNVRFNRSSFTDLISLLLTAITLSIFFSLIRIRPFLGVTNLGRAFVHQDIVQFLAVHASLGRQEANASVTSSLLAGTLTRSVRGLAV
jgi:hypothetical protein